MKKLILFLSLLYLTHSSYSQYKIKINWNKPVTKKEKVAKPKKNKILPKPIEKDSGLVKNKVIDTVNNKVIDVVNNNDDELLNSFINNWMGVKYVFGGDSRKGIDCSAFVRRLYKSVYGKVLPRTCAYQYKIIKKIKKDCLELGDLIYFRVRGSRSGWHVGVFLGDDKFVHASGRGRSVMISNLNDSFYKRIYLSGGRL
jgi:lipoprotein Spr